MTEAVQDLARIASKGVWRTFGKRLIQILYKPVNPRYEFAFKLGANDPRKVARYYLDKEIAAELEPWLTKHLLQVGTSKERVERLMRAVNDEFPARTYYMRDVEDKWNNPVETLHSWASRKALIAEGSEPVVWYATAHTPEWFIFERTDCDDYAIFFYNCARLLGVPKEQLYLCFVQGSEWHLNLMFIDDDGVPYAVEGTMYPEIALKNFGKVSYFENAADVYTGLAGKWEKRYYYNGVVWLFNEDEVRWNRTAEFPLREVSL